MKCRLVKLSKFSGNKASVYSVILNNEVQTLFDEFIDENKDLFLSELKDIVVRLQTIGHKTGARDIFFKTNEGKLGDGVCALYDKPKKSLRLYCIRYSSQLIILGSGGPKSVRALQDDEKLKKENYFLVWLSNQITNQIKNGEIRYINNYLDFSGNLKFQDNEKE